MKGEEKKDKNRRNRRKEDDLLLYVSTYYYNYSLAVQGEPLPPTNHLRWGNCCHWSLRKNKGEMWTIFYVASVSIPMLNEMDDEVENEVILP